MLKQQHAAPRKFTREFVRNIAFGFGFVWVCGITYPIWGFRTGVQPIDISPIALGHDIRARSGSNSKAVGHTEARGESPAAMIARYRTEYRDMQAEFCKEWKQKKGVDCPDSNLSDEEDASTHGHLMLLHGHLRCRLGDTPGAIASTERAIGFVPEYQQAHYQLYKIQSGIGRFAEARAHLVEVLRLDSSHFEAMIALQFLEHHLRGLDAALADGVRAADTAGSARDTLATDTLNARVCTAINASAAKVGMTGFHLCNFFDGSWRPEVLHQREGVALKEQFWSDRYLVLASVLPAGLLQYFQELYRIVITAEEADESSEKYTQHSEVHAEQRVRFTTQNRRYEFSSADVANFANMQLTPYIAALVGYELLPIYAFPVVYLQGGGIEPHRDVSENEISLSMQVRLSADGAQPADWRWPITVERPHDFYQDSVALDDNEGVLYHGTKVLHWRESNPPAATTDDYKLVQIVFAWRRVNKEQCVSQ